MLRHQHQQDNFLTPREFYARLLNSAAPDQRYTGARIMPSIQSGVLSFYAVTRNWQEVMQRHAMLMLRLSLAAVFFWFGIMKVGNVSPVVGLLKASFPFLAISPYIEMLGLAEMAIAVGLITDRFAKQAAILMVLHLLGTLSVVLISPKLIFAPIFPMLTMDGEFLAKNLVLIMAGLGIAFSRDM